MFRCQTVIDGQHRHAADVRKTGGERAIAITDTRVVDVASSVNIEDTAVRCVSVPIVVRVWNEPLRVAAHAANSLRNNPRDQWVSHSVDGITVPVACGD